MKRPKDRHNFGSDLFLDTRRVELETAWMARERDAEMLKAGGSLPIAASMRVYALEIRIKLIICGRLDLELLPKVCKTHDLSELLIFTGLWSEFATPAYDAVRGNWDILVAFSKKRLNDPRYLPELAMESDEFDRIANSLDEPRNGVLQWLSRFL